MASHEVVTQVGRVLAGVTMEEMMESVVQEYVASGCSRLVL